MNTVDNIFDWRVDILEFLAPRVGMTYKELKVWLFVIVVPAFIVILVVLCLYLWQEVRRARRAGWGRIDSSARIGR